MIVNHKRIARIMREDNLLAFHHERHLPEDKGSRHRNLSKLSRSNESVGPESTVDR